MFRRIFHPTLLPLIVLLLAVAGFLALKASRPEAPPIESRERVWRVATLSAQPGPQAPQLSLYGRIEAPDRLRAAAPVSGRVLELAVRDGQRVAAGELLARMDPLDLEPRLKQARAELEREQIRARHDQTALTEERKLLALVEGRLQRAETLRGARLGSESATDLLREETARVRLALNQREQAVAEHPARLAQAQARLDEATRDQQRAELRAPFAARIGKVEATPGQQVQAGQTLVTLYAADALILRARLPPVHLELLETALANPLKTAQGSAPAAARPPPQAELHFGNRLYHAQLLGLSGEADLRGQDALFELRQDPQLHANEDRSTLPLGAFVEARLELPARPNLLALPFSALHHGRLIYEVREGRLHAHPVERIGERRTNDQPLLLLLVPTLAAGAQVMITHLPHAVDGLAVEAIGQAQ